MIIIFILFSIGELYIYQCLKKYGFKFGFNHEFPDFVVEDSNTRSRLTVECTIDTNSSGVLPEYDIDAKITDHVSLDEKVYVQTIRLVNKITDHVSLDEKVYVQTIRLVNSISSKYKKYVDHYSRASWVNGIPYVIAVAPFEQPNAYAVGNESILAVLYGDLFMRKSQSYKRVSSVIKENNAEIPLGLFKNPNYNNVSAVMWRPLEKLMR